MDTTLPLKKQIVLHVTLWVAQCLLAAVFFMAGWTKLSIPFDQLNTVMPWTADVPEPLVRFIGISEFTGAIGLLLPSILKIKPFLTPAAATGLAIVMLLATIFHISRDEFEAIGITLAFGSVAVFIAWGRLKKVPLKSKDAA